MVPQRAPAAPLEATLRAHPLRTYGLAIVAVAVAVLLRLLLEPVLLGTLPFVTLFGAVAAAVWFGGWAPAAVAALASYVAAVALVIAPRSGGFDPGARQNLVAFAAYVFTCGLIIVIGEALHRSRRRAAEHGEILRLTLASIGDAVITTDLRGRVTYLNAVAETLTGWTEAEADGRSLDTVFRIIDEADRQPIESPASRALQEGKAVGFQNHTLLIDKQGAERAIDDSAAPIRDEHGATSGCVLIFRDVEQRRRGELLESERLLAARTLAAIVETSDDAIVSKSLDGTIRSWNAAAERLFGYTAAQAIGRHVSLVIPPERISEEDQIVASLKAGQKVDHFETERRRSDGTLIQVSLSISPLRDDQGNVIGASKIARDITERKRLEGDLRKLAGDLAEADRRKNEFLATLSHELRNPLAPMRTMLDVLRREDVEETTRAHAFDIIERQLGQLVRLVDDLLDLSRITHNRIELRLGRVDLASIVHQAVRATESLAADAGVTLASTLPSEPLYVRGDAVRLAQIFGNLLSNACKYTAQGGEVRVSVRAENGDGLVQVEDTGAGIPPDKLESIFEMFTQLDRSLERAQGGLGIGLTLVKRLVEMHGGKVEAQSAGEPHGSTFVVRLPLAPGAAAPDRAAQPAPAAATRPDPGRSILVVDDNIDAAESLALLLNLNGHRTVQAADGGEALAVAERERPQVVLLDLGLPVLNGYEVCRRLRAEPWGCAMTLIALTGWGQDEDRRKTREAGFDGHLVKPVDFTALLELLARTQAAPTPESQSE